MAKTLKAEYLDRRRFEPVDEKSAILAWVGEGNGTTLDEVYEGLAGDHGRESGDILARMANVESADVVVAIGTRGGLEAAQLAQRVTSILCLETSEYFLGLTEKYLSRRGLKNFDGMKIEPLKLPKMVGATVVAVPIMFTNQTFWDIMAWSEAARALLPVGGRFVFRYSRYESAAPTSMLWRRHLDMFKADSGEIFTMMHWHHPEMLTEAVCALGFRNIGQESLMGSGYAAFAKTPDAEG